MDEDEARTLAERAIDRLLDGDHRYLRTLRTQYDAADSGIELTGAGLFVDFDVPEDVDALPVTDDFRFGDVEAAMRGLEHGMGFSVLVRNGKLAQLEGYTYEEPLPERVEELSVDYTGDDGRDIGDTFEE